MLVIFTPPLPHSNVSQRITNTLPPVTEHIFTLAKSVETSVFINNKSKTDQPYRRRMQVLFLNLKDSKNNLRRRVISGEIAPERLASMESSEMASSERKKEDIAIKAANEKAAMMPKSQKSISDQLTCGKCGQKRVSYTQAQTRSADEPMTTVSQPPWDMWRCGVLTGCSSVNVNCVATDGSSHRSEVIPLKKKNASPVGRLPALFFTATVCLASNFKRGCISAHRTLYGGRGAPPFCVY